MASKKQVCLQSAALPFKRTTSGLKVLLITSRETGRWVLPKGNIDPGATALEAALQEAYEEAGVKGKAGSKRIGTFHYEKHDGGCSGLCHVEVFALEVVKELNKWPEKKQRRRVWMSAKKAASKVNERELRKLLLKFG